MSLMEPAMALCMVLITAAAALLGYEHIHPLGHPLGWGWSLVAGVAAILASVVFLCAVAACFYFFSEVLPVILFGDGEPVTGSSKGLRNQRDTGSEP